MSGNRHDEDDEQVGLDDYGDDQADTENRDEEVIWLPDAGEDE